VIINLTITYSSYITGSKHSFSEIWINGHELHRKFNNIYHLPCKIWMFNYTPWYKSSYKICNRNVRKQSTYTYFAR